MVAGQILTAAETVPTPPWSTACRFSAASRRRRYEHDGDARGRPRGTAACWGSSPTANGGRSGTCRSSLARLLPGACPTSALGPSSRRSCPLRFRDLRGPDAPGPHPGPAITDDRLGLQYCHHQRSLRPRPRDERAQGILSGVDERIYRSPAACLGWCRPRPRPASRRSTYSVVIVGPVQSS